MALVRDVVIIGGGVMGSATAYSLAASGFTGQIVVFERDPVHQYGSTGLSAGGVRHQFGHPANIRFSSYSIRRYEQFGAAMEVRGHQPDIEFRQRGYLVLVTEEALPALRERMCLQQSLGVEVSFLPPEAILERVPHLDLQGIAGASYCSRDGYLDPYAVMAAYEAKAKSLGVQYLHEEVVQILRSGSKATGVRTAASREVHAPVIVNAAGPWAGEIGGMAGVEVPVQPLRRQLFTCIVPGELDYPLPMIVDPSGLYFRSEAGKRILVGKSDKSAAPGFDFQTDRNYFLDEVWPVLAERMPLLDRLSLDRLWAGLYEVNHHDHNAIIGAHPDLDGFYLIGAFSGHGMMQAPAAGRALADLIHHGGYRELDASPYGFERFAAGQLIEEATLF
ncbi:MAG TPA: FAD-binding oxidoreductase [Bacillota bacterium]|nr:FAD-binding oxidoreductase [Bacillota bacterium]